MRNTYNRYYTKRQQRNTFQRILRLFLILIVSRALVEAYVVKVIRVEDAILTPYIQKQQYVVAMPLWYRMKQLPLIGSSFAFMEIKTQDIVIVPSYVDKSISTRIFSYIGHVLTLGIISQRNYTVRRIVQIAQSSTTQSTENPNIYYLNATHAAYIDSVEIGPVAAPEIKGKVIASIFPLQWW